MLIRVTKTEVDIMTIKETNLVCAKVDRPHTLACDLWLYSLYSKSPTGRDLDTG